MIGLMFLIVLCVYGTLLVAGARWGYSWAKEQGKPRPLWWGVGGFMLVLLPVFWDAIPTWIAFHYYNYKEAGLQEFKSLDQWKLENPGVAETLERYRYTRRDRRGEAIVLGDGTRRYPLNARFASDERRDVLFLSVKAWKWQLVDLKTGEVLAKFEAITSGNSGGLASGGDGWWKFWLVSTDILRAPGMSDWSRLRTAAANMGKQDNGHY